jgi:hypothetical protein
MLSNMAATHRVDRAAAPEPGFSPRFVESVCAGLDDACLGGSANRR